MSLSEYVRILGRGPGRSRSLTQQEAYEAMSLMVSGKAAPEAVGALLMLMRMKGETAQEIAGFSAAARTGAMRVGPVDLDWPSYAAGRTRGHPWFLIAARLVADAGYRVLLHGWNGQDTSVRRGLALAGIPVVSTADEAAAALDRQSIAYVPLEICHPELMSLLKLRDALGLRSCVNTVCRMFNPGQASAGVQGVFHPSYRLLQADAAQLLGARNLTVIKGGGGEFERHPGKTVAAFGLRDGRAWQEDVPARVTQTRRLAVAEGPSLPDLLSGGVSGDFEEETVLGTATLALRTLGHPNASGCAQELWRMRYSECPV